MKVLIFVSCVVAMAAASWTKYSGPLHYPVIHKGVPVEPAEVQHARAAHLSALAKAAQYGGEEYANYHNDYHNDDHYNGHKNNFDDHYDDGQYHHNEEYQAVHIDDGYHHEDHDKEDHHTYKHIVPAYETSHVKPAIGHDGKPLDTPEVEEAKAHHFAAFHKALSLVASHHYHRQRRGISSHQGHADLHKDKHGYTLHQKHAPVYGHHEHYIPKYDYHGYPLDTEEVEHLKAQHFAAHAKALHHY